MDQLNKNMGSDAPSAAQPVDVQFADAQLADVQNEAQPADTQPAVPAPVSKPDSTCTRGDCPLYFKGASHSKGLYQHEGKGPEDASTIFAHANNCNPPPFIWDAWRRSYMEYRAAMDAQKEGEDAEEYWRTSDENHNMVQRFMEEHGGGCFPCDCDHVGLEMYRLGEDFDRENQHEDEAGQYITNSGFSESW